MTQAQKNTGLKRIIHACKYSWYGLKAAWINEAAFRQEVIALVFACVIASILDISVYEKAALVGAVVFVMIVELLNSATEAVVDRIGLEKHELSGRAKDIASAAVFMAIVLAVIVWVSVIWVNFLG
jgi:diacylglycerol kinase (ATP)